MPIPRSLGRFDAWGARWAAEGTDWGAFLDRHLDRPSPDPDLEDPDFDLWQRYMRADCLQIAAAIASKLRLPVGRLTKGGQLAHAFVILPSHRGAPDQFACLDWAGVRRLKRVKDDMRDAWGRLTFDDDMSVPRPSAAALRDARLRPHVREALGVRWPRVSPTRHGRLRYLDVIDCAPPRRPGRPRRPDVIDVR